jgi:phage baseplate assembly protein W
MAQGKYINIRYPFKDSQQGFYLDLTNTDAAAIRSDLMHLILTQKGQRLYMPDFGTDLLKYIFEPNDTKTLSDIKFDINETVKKYIPNLRINEVIVDRDENNEHKATLTIDYTLTEDVFEQNDVIVINL